LALFIRERDLFSA